MPRTCLVLALLLPVLAQQGVLIPSTDPNIIYNPPLCTPLSILAGCTSPWQISNDTIPGTSVVYTDGPIPQAANVIPQLFLTFKASTLYLRTTSLSNATVNFTLTAEPSEVSITTQVNTSIGLIIADNIPETQTTTLGITFIQGDQPTRFDVDSITLIIANASATSSFLPSASLPVSASPPSIVLSPTVSSTSNSGTSSYQATIVGVVMGSILGVLCL